MVMKSTRRLKATMIDRLTAARKAAVPIVLVTTPDNNQTRRAIRAAYDRADSKTPIPIAVWDAQGGLRGENEPGDEAVAAALQSTVKEKDSWGALTANPSAALLAMGDLPGELRGKDALKQRGTIVMMLNAHRYFEDKAGVQNGQVLQGIANLRDAFKANRRTLVMLVPAAKLPPEIAQDVVVIDDPYPTDEELQKIVTTEAEKNGFKVEGKKLESAVDALRGLSAFSAEQIVAMSTGEDGLNEDEMWEQKITVIEQTDGFSVDRGLEDFEDVRGLANFLEFGDGIIMGKRGPTLYVRLDELEKMFGSLGAGSGDNTGITQDRLGVMLRKMEDNKWTGLIAVGHAGCGKSLVTKALANEATKRTGRRVLSVAMDLGAITTKEAGESERKIRVAMKLLESLAAGGRVCFVATCNEIRNLPAALKRRFKLGTWMFDLPEAEDKKAQWELNMKLYDLKKQELPDDTDWTGADIRNVCDVADQLSCTIKKACQYVTFVAKSDPKAIEDLRVMADGKFVDASKPGTYKAPFTSKPFTGPDAAPARRAGRSEEV